MHRTPHSPALAPPALAFARWGIAAAIVLGSVAALFALGRFWSAKFYRTSGEAQWLWSHHRIAADEPEAFYLRRDFDLPPARAFVRIRVAADPGFTLWFNGVEVGGQASDGRTLFSYDVSAWARDQGNRIVLAARSPRGVGGVLATVDLGPLKQNWLSTDESWHLHSDWSPSLLEPSARASLGRAPRILGRPPIGRWNYPEERTVEPYPAEWTRVDPQRSVRYRSWLPKIEKKSGVIVAGRRTAEAIAFDFGHVEGRAAIRVAPGPKRAIVHGYASAPHQLAEPGLIEHFVVGEGEGEVVSPESRAFRYLVVYDEDVEAWVVGERR